MTVKVLKEREDEDGNKFQEEVEEQKQEEYEEPYTEEISREDAMLREAKSKMYDRVASFTIKKTRTVNYMEVNENGVNIEKTKLEEIEEPLFSKPIKVAIKDWEVHKYDPSYEELPKEAIYFEMFSGKETDGLLQNLQINLIKTTKLTEQIWHLHFR